MGDQGQANGSFQLRENSSENEAKHERYFDVGCGNLLEPAAGVLSLLI